MTTNSFDMPSVDETDQSIISDFLNRVFFHPLDFISPGAIDTWPALFTRGYEILAKLAQGNPNILSLEEMLGHCLNMVENSKLMYYATHASVRAMLEARARCAAAYLTPRMPGANGWNPPRKKNDRQCVDLAIYMKDISQYTETFAAIPFFLCLDPRRFRATVYVDKNRDVQMVQDITRRGWQIVKLTDCFVDKLNRIRSGVHDILLITSNTSAMVNEAFIFGLFGAARRQLVQFCQPYTTGLPHVDGFIVGSALQVNQDDFSEKLLTIPGSGICFSQGDSEEPSPITLTRTEFNIPEKAIVFISGANYYKIRTELLDFWARLLASNPNSTLVLFPFGPAWTSQYPVAQFMERVRQVAMGRGISPERFIICKPLPRRADVRRLIGLCDVYLDSFPYSGATSLLDPFSLHMPIVAMGTRTVCGGQGAAMLRECGLSDLVAADEDDYLRIAGALAASPVRRAEVSAKMATIMAATPPFHDMEAFARKVAPIYEEVARS